MALPVYMKIEGQTQKVFDVEKLRDGHHEEVIVLGFDHGIDTPFDAASGVPLGRIQHNPIRIMKMIDVTSPQLYAAMVGKEQLTVEFRWWRANKDTAEEEQYHTITISNATVVGMKQNMSSESMFEGGPVSKGGTRANSTPHMEEVSFSYHDIRWENMINGKEAGDSYSRET